MNLNRFDMGKYTMEIGAILSRGGEIFDFPYPFYDESYRPIFEQKFLLHFRYHEIGQESLERFKYMLKDVLTTEYPKYLHYFKASQRAQELKWWNNKDYESTVTRTLDTESNGKSDSTSTGASTSEFDSNSTDDGSIISRYSETPEGTIDDIDNYLTNASKDNSNSHNQSHDETTSSSLGSSKSNSESKGNEKEVITTIEGGNIGVTSSGELVKSWLKDAYINVDKMIFDDCESLFMQIY